MPALHFSNKQITDLWDEAHYTPPESEEPTFKTRAELEADLVRNRTQPVIDVVEVVVANRAYFLGNTARKARPHKPKKRKR